MGRHVSCGNRRSFVESCRLSGQRQLFLLTEAIFQNARNAVEICIGLAGILSFWLGMLKLIEEAGIAEKYPVS